MDFSNQQPVGLPLPGSGLTASIGGILPIKSISQLQAEERAQAQATNAKPYLVNLAGHIRNKWAQMKTAKIQTVEPRLLQCLRQRRGEYDEDKLQKIKQQGGSEIFMMLSSNKARAASSWIRDVTTDISGAPFPYTLTSTPEPSIPPHVVQREYTAMQQELQQAAALGLNPSPSELEEYVEARKEMIMNTLREEAQEAANRMKRKMDDQFAEGGMRAEYDKFIDDFVTFPYAVLKGPVVKRRKGFSWKQSPAGYDLAVTDELVPTWERVDPFMLYWEAHMSEPDEGDLIERHRLTRADLNAMKGTGDGYNDAAINAVLDEYGRGGLKEWLWVDAQKAVAEGKSLSAVMGSSDGLIDALQFWGSVQGKLLIEWGIDEATVEDPLADYPVEAWLIGTWVIKAIVNPDPLGRKPYFKSSYEKIPGAWMGNSPMDLIRDCQDVCNASARALVNNMGIASGPQVWVNVDRLPAGESITQLFPWRIQQTTSDPLGSSAPPMDFFQPNSLSQELMAVYERFSVLADEYSGIPRYMTGDAPAGGAGRTASGMNMLMNNAGKAIKQVIANIDRDIITRVVDRTWFYNMRYSDDPDLKGDVKCVAQGANSLLIKEAAAQRRNEFLQIGLTNPLAQQIMGVEGVAHLLREQASTLDMNADKIVPAPEIVKARAAVAQAQQLAIQQQQAQQPDETVSIKRGEDGQMESMQMRRRPAGPVSSPNQNLMNGAPVTDHFSPMRLQ